MRKLGRVLIIAGSDSSGGAGIQADIKTVTALGGYAMTAITALTVQDTRRVYDIHAVPLKFIRNQIEVTINDIGVDAVKIGMLGQSSVGEVIADCLSELPAAIPKVVDPVMVATSGDALADDDISSVLCECLFSLKNVIATPNVPELEILSGCTIIDSDSLVEAGSKLAKQYGISVIAKGGHLNGDEVTDFLITHDGACAFQNPRLQSQSTHGTGCTLASAVATGLAQNIPLENGVEQAIHFVRKGIETAPGFGCGNGPLNHMHGIQSQKEE